MLFLHVLFFFLFSTSVFALPGNAESRLIEHDAPSSSDEESNITIQIPWHDDRIFGYWIRRSHLGGCNIIQIARRDIYPCTGPERSPNCPKPLLKSNYGDLVGSWHPLDRFFDEDRNYVSHLL